jgi:replicative DNA helicase
MPEVARFTYTDSEGIPVYDSVRIEPGSNGRTKDFGLERVERDSTRVSGPGCMDGVERVPYRLPELLAGIKAGKPVYFVEGEKCADVLISQGLIATTRSEGAQASLPDNFIPHFAGASEIIVLADSDIPGRQAAATRARKLAGLSPRLKIVDLSPKRTDGYDVADFFAEGGLIRRLHDLVEQSPEYIAPVVEKPPTAQKGVEAAKVFSFADLLHSAVQRTEDAVENGPRVYGSPWKSLNKALGGNTIAGGFAPTETAIWAAVPGGGKSAATWMVADHAAVKHPGTAVLVSAEMGEIDAVQRLMSLYSGITTAQLRSGKLSSSDWERLAYTEKHLANRRLAVIGRDGRDLNALHKSIESIAKAGPISCIVVDHIGKILQKNSVQGRTKNDAAEDIIEALANWAIEYDCVMHVVQHLNRAGYGQRPTLANLRDGGNTEGHANIVIFPYRKFPNGGPELREKGELVLEKCRDGYTGSIPMKFVGERYMWVEANETSMPWFEEEES